MIEHAIPECTGYWKTRGPVDDRVIYCERCPAVHPGTLENRMAAMSENYAGIRLHRLANAGAEQLQSAPEQDQ